MTNLVRRLTQTPEYKELSLLELPWDVIYGPVASRRLGQSLGINLLGQAEKICNFNCGYCDLGLTEIKISSIKKKSDFVTVAAMADQLQKKIFELLKAQKKIDHISFVGNGEPTLHPEFSEVVNAVRGIRDELLPECKIVVLSNGSTLGDSKIIKAMNLLDERMIKVDSGNEDLYQKVNDPLVRMNIAKLIQSTKKLTDIVAQSMFVQGAIENTNNAQIEEWIEVIGIIKPKLVHLYTLDRVPPLPGLKAVPHQRLKEISNQLTKRTRIKGLIFA